MQKLLRRAFLFVGILVILFLGLITYFSESSPKVVPSGDADSVANKMLNALNVKAWDTLQTVSWKSNGALFLWHKPTNALTMSWDDIRVEMQLDKVDGKVYKNGIEINDKSAIKKAWAQWCNDSFWMFAPYKVFDKGTTRSLVPMEKGKIGLMIEYSSGGVTPGDKYLWILNEKYIPEGWKMWVKIIPIGGTYASWENWKQLKSGIFVAPKHKMKLYEFEFTDIQ
jgi:hypothetical protein